MRGDQLARQWQLVQHLARSRGGVGLGDLSENLGCVRRTVYRDLNALMYAGFPVVSEKRDGHVFYRFLDSFQIGNVPFTPDELLALAFSEDLLGALEGTVFHDSIHSALEKIRAGLGPELSAYLRRLGESFKVMPGPHKRYAECRDTIQALNDAVLRRRVVEIRYRTGRSGAVRTRRLDPYRVWYSGGGLYVIGFDHLSEEVRTFAVDRIRKIKATGDDFEILPDFDFDAHLAHSFGVIAEPATKVRIHFAKAVRTYVEERTWHPSQEVRELAGGRIEVCLEVGDTAELRSWILSFGADARVQEPESLVREIAKELARGAANYS
jgi:predicted DNA-binding transcriptional regulator YafY